MPRGRSAASARERWSPLAADAYDAARRLAEGEAERAGGALLRAGPVPLALHDAVWMPEPARVAELAAGPDDAADALLPVGDPAEAALRAAGHRPALGVVLDDPFVAGERSDPPAANDGRVGWHGARDVAEVLADAYGAPELLAPLATTLASIASADPGLHLHLAGAPGEPPAALVAVESGEAVVVLLAGGPAGPLAARVLAEGGALGKRTCWTRVCAPGDPRAALTRWEPPR